ncbi:MAG: Fur family transcriptional regulator, ferric uptake regulator [Frankiaceae bacterium]|nr:Fur family transcriptional regulator, ferric uptake regulator [Frankiaceae bacterium]MDQ1636452.1 Fur family transcriptional regulator, ferric uptake regulator [Frankiaceae bacterium]MDQ1672277.1 Fur family transcriptional regulator, ferric uptake regulator [Frankiaceae bacterium]
MTTARAGRARSTRQGVAVESLLEASSGFRSAQDLHAELRRRGDAVGLTTVYRHLQSLVDGGSVDMLRTVDGEALYRQCADSRHHHHLVCRRCGTAVEVSGQAVERWAGAVAREHGFTDVDHTVEVVGTCGECSAGPAPSS